MKKFLSIALVSWALFFSGCGSSENFVFTNTNVGRAPLCQSDAYNVNEDTALVVNAADGVLANDTPNGGTATFAATSSGGGTITGNADGSFTYTPLNGFTGDDTFGYTVSNTVGQSDCTVTVTVVAVNGFFVDSVNGNDGTGSFQGGLPFQTILAAVVAAPDGADIVVLPGNYPGTVNLKDGQRLLGAGSLLVNSRELVTQRTLRLQTFLAPIDPDKTFFVSSEDGDDSTGQEGPSFPFATIQAAVDKAPEGADIVVESGRYTDEVQLKLNQRLLGSGSAAVSAQGSPSRPLIDGGRIVMGDGNTVDFFRVINSPDDAIDGNGCTNGTVTNCEIENIVNADGVGLENSSGSWNVSNNKIRNLGGITFGIVVALEGTAAGSYIINNNEITGGNGGAIGLLSEDTSNVKAQVHGNVMRGNNTSAIGDAFEVEVRDTSTFCLDLETNIADLDTNPNNSDDGVFSLFDSPGPSLLEVEQFAGGNLTNPRPGGAGNSGVIEDNTGIGDMPTSVADDHCFPPVP